MTESPDPAAPSQPDTGLGFTVSRTQLLFAFGGLALLALSLSILAKRKPVQTDSTVLIGDDWRTSMQHLASAWDIRYAGMENRMSDIERMLRAAVGDPEPGLGAPVPSPAQAANITDVAPVQANGTHPPVGAEEPPPPGPASVSL